MIDFKLFPGLPLVVLDKNQTWTGDSANIIYWEDVGSDINVVYLPLLVDKFGDELKRSYISRVDRLAHKVVNGSSTIDTLRDKNGFSFWWMSLLSEKSPWKSGEMFSVFRAMLLEELLSGFEGDDVFLVSHDTKLIKWLSKITEKCEKSFTHQSPLGNKTSTRFLWKRRVPKTILSILFVLRQISRCRKSLFSKPAVKPITDKNYSNICTIIDYSVGFEPNKLTEGQLQSKYWGELIDKITHNSASMNWITWFIPSKEFPSLSALLKAKAQYSRQSNNRLLVFEEFFSFKVLCRSIKRYIELRKKAPNFRDIIGCSSDVMVFLEDDWSESVKGIVATDACIRYSILEEALSALPEITSGQGTAIYLYENQAWERALNFIWKRNSSHPIFGFQHVSGKFYDLRPFDGTESERWNAYDESPLPNKVIVTGEGAYKDLVAYGFPKERVYIAESLRSLYLKKFNFNALSERNNTNLRTLLVVTDYLSSATRAQLKLLSEAWHDVDESFDSIIIKPHPSCPVEDILEEYDLAHEGKIVVEKRSLDKLWSEADIVYTSNVTGAALESAYMQLPTVICYSSESFNMSPLRGNDSVSFIASALELKKAITGVNSSSIPNNYICLDLSLDKWRKLLNFS
ncbi:TIGR04326 family surface carbohydrate biosynthesis protein [Vibrio sp. T11.5]|uniref:TIGR04326 family surface carbohydrate biosynthesis protein n=1 Tax=Vibrio sp. T11.5 TaxID=2998836 RepID=UPI0022CD7E68|nr:TIGR04326 family surface carbohydrate biosynthesis protein [Vibrio sp. T11.5]MDA0119787.1 hypothetical protein [Vibrio sp. T11.5]